MTPQQKMKAKLEQTGIPAKEIKVYGSQIMITAWSRSAAEKWAHLLGKLAKVRGVVESIERTKDQQRKARENPGIVKSVYTHRVWLVAASI